MDKLKFGEFIYNKRKNLKLTQDDLGRKLGVTNKAVSKWETGETLPDIQILPMLASALDVTIDELLTQTKPEPVIVHAKPKIKLHIIQAAISLVLLILSFVLLIMLIPKWVSFKKLTVENSHEYITVNYQSYQGLSEQSLTINGEVIEEDEIKDFSMVLSFTIKYNYLNSNDEKCEILYLNREVNLNEENHSFELFLEPKSPILDFKTPYSFDVVYEIKEVNGKIA